MSWGTWQAAELSLFTVIFIASALLTLAVRQYALRRQLLDIPNQRSSHTTPIPRGGGIAIVITFLSGCGYLYLNQQLSFELFMALSGGGLLLALIGFWEDHRPLSIRLRLSAHFVAAAWGLYWLNTSSQATLFTFADGLFWLQQLITLIGFAWLINLYNFMDGIDGIAASEAIFVALAALLLITKFSSPAPSLLLILALLIASCGGFLLFNWQPASIFMGDSGSYFLGFTIGIIALSSIKQNNLPIWVWCILLAAFWVDATITLLRRIVSGQRWYSAHRSHAYQHAARRLQSHSHTTTALLMINTGWLFTCAYLASAWPQWAALITVLAILPILLLVLSLGAGRKDIAKTS